MPTRQAESRSSRPEIDDAPLHPTIIAWLRRYTAAGDDHERDRVVAGILEDLNAALASASNRRADAPG